MDELLFFDRLPRFLPVYEALKETLAARYPEMTVRVTKTQISFRSRSIFAMTNCYQSDNQITTTEDRLANKNDMIRVLR